MDVKHHTTCRVALLILTATLPSGYVFGEDLDYLSLKFYAIFFPKRSVTYDISINSTMKNLDLNFKYNKHKKNQFSFCEKSMWVQLIKTEAMKWGKFISDFTCQCKTEVKGNLTRK